MFDAIRNTLSLGSQQDEPDEDDDGEEWPYELAQDDVEQVEGQSVIAHDTEKDEIFAGPLARDMMEGPRHNPDQPLFFGVGTRRGRHAGIEQEDLLKHTVLLGPTGYGKTTVVNNMIRTQAEADLPVVSIEPKGDDSPKLIDILPDHRIKNGDLVWLEPGGNRSATVGFNILDPGVNPDDPMFDTAVENLVEDLTKMIGIDEYWGPRMDGITKTMVRATARLDHEFTLLDLYYILAEEENAREFATLVDQSGLAWLNYTEKIAEMDDDNLDPIRRRLKDWVEDPIARRVIAFRESTVNIAEIIEDRKILVVRMGPEREELKQMVSTAIVRRLWSHIRARAEMREIDRIPCNLFMDEFDYIAHQDSAIPTMLSKARSLGLGIFMAMQHPGQIPDPVAEAMFANSNTVLSFKSGHPDHARQIAKVLGIDPSILTSEAPHHVWMQMMVERNGRKETAPSFRTYCHPPFPPLRSEAERWHIIERSAREYGRKPLSSQELRDGLLIDKGSGPSNPDDDPLAEPTGVAGDMSDEQWRNQALKAIYDETIRKGNPGGWIPVTDCVERLNQYLPGKRLTDDGKVFREVVLKIPDPYIDRDEKDGVPHVKPLDTGFLNLGESENDGKAEHWAQMADAYVPMTQLGFIFEIPEQTGNAMPDGLARIDDLLTIESSDGPEEITDKVTSYREDHQIPNRLAGTKDAYIESEHTTGSTQPSQTVRNLAQAHNAGHRCLFFSREEVAEDVYDTVAHEPFCCRSNHPDDSERRFYTGTQALRIDGDVMTRPGSRENVWVYDKQTGKYLLRDSDGTVHARFDSAADIFTNASAYPAGGERNIKPPVIPEYEMDGDLDAVEWDVIVVPPETQTPMDLRLYEGNTQTPLTALPTADTETTDESTPATESSTVPETERAESDALGDTAIERRDTDRDERAEPTDNDVSAERTDEEPTEDTADDPQSMGDEETAESLDHLL